MDSKDTPSPFEGIPIMVQSPEQQAWFKKHVTEHDANAFCVDCKSGQSSFANLHTGTFHCAKCAKDHKESFPLLCQMKEITETFDNHQLRILACSGGNTEFFEWMKKYDGYIKQFTIAEKYKNDACLYYCNRVNHKAREIYFLLRAPPTSDLERAKFAADDANAITNQGI